jgi:hypothetical protein
MKKKFVLNFGKELVDYGQFITRNKGGTAT